MRVDVESLEEFNLLAREGAQEASEALATMTDTDASIDVAKITVVDRRDIVRSLREGDYEGVAFDIEGRFSGTVLMTFGQAAVDELTDSLVPGSADESMVRSSLEELGNIMIGGFMTGWGDHLETGLDMSPPRYLEPADLDDLEFDVLDADSESILVFQSEITWLDRVADIDIYFAPDKGSVRSVVADDGADDGGTVLALDKLSVFSDLTREGTEMAAQRVTTMAGMETSADISGISFTPIDDITAHVDDTYVGTTVAFEGRPSGFLVILFDEGSARRVASAMLPGAAGDADDGEAEFTDMHRSAIEELGNIMTSGFIDGWANVLQSSVEHQPPTYEDDVEMALLEIVTDQLGPFQTHGFVVESTMRTDEVDFHCEILAIPNEEELSAALDELLVERRDETDVDPDDLF